MSIYYIGAPHCSIPGFRKVKCSEVDQNFVESLKIAALFGKIKPIPGFANKLENAPVVFDSRKLFLESNSSLVVNSEGFDGDTLELTQIVDEDYPSFLGNAKIVLFPCNCSNSVSIFVSSEDIAEDSEDTEDTESSEDTWDSEDTEDSDE